MLLQVQVLLLPGRLGSQPVPVVFQFRSCALRLGKCCPACGLGRCKCTDGSHQNGFCLVFWPSKSATRQRCCLRTQYPRCRIWACMHPYGIGGPSEVAVSEPCKGSRSRFRLIVEVSNFFVAHNKQLQNAVSHRQAAQGIPLWHMHVMRS